MYTAGMVTLALRFKAPAMTAAATRLRFVVDHAAMAAASLPKMVVKPVVSCRFILLLFFCFVCGCV
jgi:hypothetical protein